MDTQKTYVAKKGEVVRNWVLINLDGRVLGRAATQIANILRGKNKPVYTPHEDTGDFVIAINASKVRLTGNKMKEKVYYRHTGFIGGIKEITAERLLARNPAEMIRRAVHGMLPKNRSNKHLLRKLKIYAGPVHPHAAQQPKEASLS